MKRIGVVSDTHMRGGGIIPEALERGLSGTDLILHAGDILTEGTLDLLELIAPVRAVRGNCDDFISETRVPPVRIVKVEGYRIGLIHSLGTNVSHYGAAAEKIFEDRVDCVVFGHTHKPYDGEHKGIVLFNPGSAGQRRTERFYSYGIIIVKDGGIISRDIIYF